MCGRSMTLRPYLTIGLPFRCEHHCIDLVLMAVWRPVCGQVHDFAPLPRDRLAVSVTSTNVFLSVSLKLYTPTVKLPSQEKAFLTRRGRTKKVTYSMKTKTAEIKTFGSLATCTQQTHNFAPPSRGGFAVSMFQQGRANIKQNGNNSGVKL